VEAIATCPGQSRERAYIAIRKKEARSGKQKEILTKEKEVYRHPCRDALSGDIDEHPFHLE
jgi:hypothetical protein